MVTPARPACTELSTDDIGVAVDRKTCVGTIEIHRGPNNYLNTDVLAQVVDVMYALADRGARAVVLASAGKHFCAGADFTGGTQAAGRSIDRDMYDVGLQLLEQPLPIVAATQGSTIGGGVGLALVADFRVASPSSRFWINFSNLGTHHGFGLTVTLPLVIGYQRATELLYTGRRINGVTAHDIGLCDYLVASEEIRYRATALAEEIADTAPAATQAIRRTMRQRMVEAARAAMDHERSVQKPLMELPDFREGVLAARERRRPYFSIPESISGSP